MEYKHISKLTNWEKEHLISKHPDYLDKAVDQVVDEYKREDYEKINENTIRNQLNKLLLETDEVVNIETYDIYIRK